MSCWRCGNDGEVMQRVMVFNGEEPTNTELAELLTGPGLCLCGDCVSGYLDWLESPVKETVTADD